MSSARVIQIFGEAMEVILTSRATRNSCCAAIHSSAPGGGPPPHSHTREDELFYVLQGEYEFFDGRDWTPVSQGECRFGIRGTPHGFRNCGATVGRMLITITPGGLDEYFGAISPLSLPPDAARVAEINGMFGVTFLDSGA